MANCVISGVGQKFFVPDYSNVLYVTTGGGEINYTATVNCLFFTGVNKNYVTAARDILVNNVSIIGSDYYAGYIPLKRGDYVYCSYTSGLTKVYGIRK